VPLVQVLQDSEQFGCEDADHILWKSSVLTEVHEQGLIDREGVHL